MSASPLYSLVLLGRFPGKDRAVALALSRDFGRDDAWGLQVVGAAPIVLLDGLSREQADAVHEALSDVEQAGSRFEVQGGVDAGLPKLGWNSPARIKGRSILEYGSDASTVSIVLPCPYTGQKMKLTLSISLTKVGNEVQASVSNATATIVAPAQISQPAHSAPIPIPIPVPSTAQNRPAPRSNTAFAPIPSPTAPSARGSGQTVAVPQPLPVAPIQSDAEGDDDLDGLDDLTPLPQIPAHRPPAPRAAPSPRAPAPRSPSDGVPLPDVPVLPGGANHGRPTPPNPGSNEIPLPSDLMSGPMDLSAFEEQVSASGIMRAVSDSDAPEAEAVEEQEEAPVDNTVCSVFMGKSSSPKVHNLVAELQGITVPEAAKLCQKPIVALAKDISLPEAQDLKQQFASVNVQVRITKRNG